MGAAGKPLGGLVLLGALLLMVSAAASALLSAKHIWSLQIIGCGPQDDCDWVLHSAWGSLAGWPIAFLGLAYFCGLLALWLITGWDGPSRPLRYVTRLAAVASVVLVAYMLIERHVCFWCAAVHAANLAWWIFIELISFRRRAARAAPALSYALTACVFLFVAVTGRWLEAREQLRVQAAEYEQAMQDIEAIGAADQPPPVTIEEDPPNAPPAEPEVFRGRYLLGPRDAAVRVVAFTDYRCGLCQEVEGVLSKLLDQRSDVSLSLKQFPMDRECNHRIYGKSRHPGACRGARAAESIGLLGGEEAFWRIHEWLVRAGGLFTRQEIESQVRALGLDVQRFWQLYDSEQVAKLIAADIEEGVALGLIYTPMLFVNGYPLRNWRTAGVLPAAIERAASQPPRAGDRPPLAIDGQFAQWERRSVKPRALTEHPRVRGPSDAPVTILVFADYRCPYHHAASKLLEESLRGRDDVGYAFRHFPIDASCNERVKVEGNPGACDAARLVEAGYLLGGLDAYWRVHDWLMAHFDEPFDAANLQPVADACGLDAAALRSAMKDPAVEARIQADLELARGLGVDRSPTIYVNGKWVEVWRTPGLLDRIITSAAEHSAAEPQHGLR